MTNPTPTPVVQPQNNHRQLTIIMYALYGAGYFLGGITTIIAIIMNYIKRSEITDPVLASHITWQIRTFWITLGVAILGAVTTVIIIGFPILIGICIWNIYRLVRGLLAVLDNKPMPTPK
ncbi:DUF4870 family protein [Paenalcaligenes faecalis]|uniref:DUF4870 family protein n=1 Tax=Paenalcaligenes faecalis TaxID=2980099 RepID=UPI0022B9BE3D|nr:hypothetical protein [Paenalcaligenes faecalis]